MSAALTVDSLSAILGREVEEIQLTVAKSSAMGLDPETIANSIGLARAEVEELMLSQDYKDVRLLVGSEMLRDRTERDTNWDGIESTAVQKLGRRLEFENDTDTLLKIAAVANRAQRRTAPPKEIGPLDPSQAGARVPLTLTKRFTEKLNDEGRLIERTETQQISVLNGSAVNPKFEDVKRILSGFDTAEGAGQEIEPQRHESPSNSSTRYLESIKGGDEPFSMDELLKAAQRAKK